MQKRRRIFISYKRNIKPDETIALEVFKQLSKDHDIFIDQTMLVGTKWAKEIEKQLRKSDYLISFLSANSVKSEMVLAEIETAHRLNKQFGKPAILPVRLNYIDQLVYPLSAYLNSINYALWEKEQDTPDLVEQLSLAIQGQNLSSARIMKAQRKKKTTYIVEEPSPSATPIIDSPDGTMSPHSKTYIERESDRLALQAIKGRGVTITIKGSRQMGKSSLLNYIIESAIEGNKKVAFLDFQLVEKDTLHNATAFYQHFCRWISYELGLEDKVEKYWKVPLGNTQLCSKYIKEHVLQSIKTPIVISMDEVEKIFETKYYSDFFGMLRSWHNNRSYQKEWKNLDLALITSTEPYLFIPDLNQSPFNVGLVLELQDFSSEQVSDLNKRYNRPLSPKEEKNLFELLSGHPYLTNKALYMAASKRMTASELFSHASDERGPFGDHLRYNLFHLHTRKELVNGLRQVLRNNRCTDENIFLKLRGAGLVCREENNVITRNKLYRMYFSNHL